MAHPSDDILLPGGMMVHKLANVTLAAPCVDDVQGSGSGLFSKYLYDLCTVGAE